MAAPEWHRGKFGTVLLLFQLVFIVLFGALVDYDHEADAKYKRTYKDADKGGYDPSKNSVKDYYPMFQDVHVMIFVGFGFLMTFLKRYVFGSVGLNMLIASFVLQWATLMGGFLHLHGGRIEINVQTMLTSDFAAAAVLITFGAMLGKLSPLQQIVMAFLEIIIFSVNEYIGLSIFRAADVGGSMFVHVFGAYFGLALGRVLWTHDLEKAEKKEGSEYHSDTFAMIGTLFLWLFWPSFNSALAPGDDQHRAVLNTYYALSACCVVAFAMSSLLDKHNKFDMVHIQNATLAGGVAVGTSADMMIYPFGALIIGSLAGALSVVGYRFITPFLNKRLRIHDTCGVNNLHGMPGLLAGICGIVVAGVASESHYGYGLYQTFPARAPLNGSEALIKINKDFSLVDAGDNRSAGVQAGYQAVSLVVTLVFAIVGGAITGLVLRLPLLDPLRQEQVYDDTDWWEIPETGFPSLEIERDPIFKKPFVSGDTKVDQSEMDELTKHVDETINETSKLDQTDEEVKAATA